MECLYMKTIDVHWIHCGKTWAIPGYEVRENPEQHDGDIGILVDDSILIPNLQHAYETKIAVFCEPRAKMVDAHEAVDVLHKQFRAIITSDAQLLRLSNSHAHPLGGSCIGFPQSFIKQFPKIELLTMVVSWKVYPGTKLPPEWDPDALDGYSLRWQAAEMLMGRGVKIYGSLGHGAIAIGGGAWEKARVLGPAMFSVEVECHKSDHWFTEKLLDCLLLDVVPVYRGPDNIGDYFDTRGMLLWSTIQELNEIVDQILAGEIVYKDFRPYILSNRKNAMQWADLTRSCCRTIGNVLRAGEGGGVHADH